MNLSIRIGDLELRSCDEHLFVQDVTHTTAEIVKWERTDSGKGKESCYTVAYWVKGSAGYDVMFVGNRPFEIDKNTLWILLKSGQTLLNEYYKKEQNESDT